jgi:hypothetical protein
MTPGLSVCIFVHQALGDYSVAYPERFLAPKARELDNQGMAYPGILEFIIYV